MNAIQSSIIALVLTVLLFSCNTTNNQEPQEPAANLKLTIALDGTKIVVTDPATGEVLTNIDYHMGNVASLIYVVHDATNGKFLKALNLPPEAIKLYVKDGVATMYDLLPFGNYYITMVTTTQNRLENTLLADGLSKDYPQAVCQLPNEHIYYATFRVDCMPPYGQLPATVTEDIDFTLNAILRRMTGEYALEANTKKIPAGSNFSLLFDVKDVPSSIFIASGKTLTNAEAIENKMNKFSKKTTTENVSVSSLTSILGKVYLLQNDYLPASERGSIAFTYKENKTSTTATRSFDEAMPERTGINNLYFTIIDLYSNGVGHEEK